MLLFSIILHYFYDNVINKDACKFHPRLAAYCEDVSEIRTLRHQLEQTSKKVEQQQQILEQKDTLLSEKDRKLDDTSNLLSEKETELSQKTKQVADKDAQLSTQSEQLQTLNHTAAAFQVEDVSHMQGSLSQWVDHLKTTSPDGQSVVTRRTICRELDAMAQTCVFEGLMCVNVSTPENKGHPHIFIVDDTQPDGLDVPSDNWCKTRSYSADPRYYSSRVWPPMEGTVIPQQSCMSATYRKLDSLLQGSLRIRWEPSSLALLDVDLRGNDHNTHFLMDLLWVLDARLFQRSLSVQPRPGYRQLRGEDNLDTQLLKDGVKYYIPLTTESFYSFTARDINKLTFSIMFNKNLTKMYNFSSMTLDALRNPRLSPHELSHNLGSWDRHLTMELLDAHPELRDELVFHNDVIDKKEHDLVCTPRLTAGIKTGFSTAERVCSHIRHKSYELYNIEPLEIKISGQLRYERPPRRVLIMDRHFTRKVVNFDEVVSRLTELLAKHDVNVTSTTTDRVFSAEDYVRIYSSAGIIVVPHGGQNMGEMFMRRHRYALSHPFVIVLSTVYTLVSSNS